MFFMKHHRQLLSVKETWSICSLAKSLAGSEAAHPSGW